jgi:DNA-binding IscR family transcriptional regulator
VTSWTFLTIHARVLLLVANDPGVRLRDIAASLNITERSAFGIITDLVEAGYVIKEKDGRRNRYRIQVHLPLPEPTARERTVGEVLALLAGTDAAEGEETQGEKTQGEKTQGEKTQGEKTQGEKTRT